MKDQNKISLGFGSSNPRFGRVGFYPELDKYGSYKKELNKNGPAQYYPQFKKCHRAITLKSEWTRKSELEEFSKYLGFRNAPILAARAHHRSHLGPGLYKIPEDIDRQKSSSVVEDKGFTTEKRFIELKKFITPPVGTYGRNIFKKPQLAKKFGNVQRFEWDGVEDRFKYTDYPKRQTSCFYNVRDQSSIEALLHRVVSRRDTYNISTGARDGSSIKDYFSYPKKISPDWFYIKPADIDNLLHNPKKYKTGKFFQAPRFPKKNTERVCVFDKVSCYRDPNDPGPQHYDLSNLTTFKTVERSLFPFNVCVRNQRPPLPWSIYPGPGRYRYDTPKCRKKPKASWVFLCRGERVFFTKPQLYSYIDEWVPDKTAEDDEDDEFFEQYDEVSATTSVETEKDPSQSVNYNNSVSKSYEISSIATKINYQDVSNIF